MAPNSILLLDRLRKMSLNRFCDSILYMFLMLFRPKIWICCSRVILLDGVHIWSFGFISSNYYCMCNMVWEAYMIEFQQVLHVAILIQK